MIDPVASFLFLDIALTPPCLVLHPIFDSGAIAGLTMTTDWVANFSKALSISAQGKSQQTSISSPPCHPEAMIEPEEQKEQSPTQKRGVNEESTQIV